MKTKLFQLLTGALVAFLFNNAVAQTDITNSGGTISALYTDSPTGEDIAKVIDNQSSTKYLTFHASGWIQFQAASSYVVTRYSITSANDTDTRDPKDWTFQGSNDGLVWTSLDTRSNEDFTTRFLRREFTFSNSTAYVYYRLQMTNNSGTILQLAEWEILGVPATVATVYKHCNYSTTGYGVSLPVGDYTTSQLTAKGIINNDISSLQINSGYEVVLYDLDNFLGSSVIIQGNNTCLTANNFNDLTSSLRVRAISVNQSPSVSITSPASNAAYTAPATIAITANASDADGLVSKVEFYNGTTKLGEDAAAPYTFIWNNVAEGTYTLMAKATDNAGAQTTSASIAITVTAVERDITDYGGLMSAQYGDSPSNEGVSNLVDNLSSTKFLTFNSSVWVQLQQANASVVKRYTLTSANDSDSRDPKDWTFQGSNDGITWITLDTRTNEDFPARFQKREFTFSNNTSFTYYRIQMTNNSGTILQLAEVEIVGTGGGGNVIPTPPLTWQENWFDHTQLVSRVFYDEDVAVYFDGDMSRNIIWMNNYVGDAWRYSKQVYGDMSGGSPDKRLYAIFHQNKYGGGHPSYYFDGSHGYKNVIDLGQNGSWTNPTGWSLDATIHEIGHVVESTTNNAQGSPAFPLWGDSKWCVIYQYDVYVGLGWNSEVQRWFNENINKTDSYPRANTYWFRDWFYPIWNNYGKSEVLSKFFQLMAQYFPKNGRSYSRNMNYGEFVHFWSGAAGVNLKAQATIAFGWPAEWEAQFNQARVQFPQITYAEPVVAKKAANTFEAADKLSVWNTGESLNVYIPEDATSDKGQLEIYSSQGILQMKKTVAISDRMTDIDVSKLGNGLYVLILENEGKVYKTSVVISK